MAYTEKERYWSRFADDFEERNNYVVGKENIQAIFDVLQKQQGLNNCLELGCGNGTYSKIIAPQCTQLVATDHSDEMVLETSRRLKGFAQIKVEKANCFDSAFPDEYFDTVFMANLFHIIPHQEEMLREVRRVLKPGGKLIIVSYTTYTMSFVHKISMIYRYIKTYGKPSPYAVTFKPEETLDTLSQNGFSKEETDIVGFTSKALFIKARKN